MKFKSIIVSLFLIFFCSPLIFGQENILEYVASFDPDPSQTRRTYGIHVVDNYAYTATAQIGLTIFDVSDPLNAQVIGSLSLPTITSHTTITVEGDFVYLSGRNDKKLYIIDISNKTNPTLVSTYEAPYYTSKSVVIDQYLYLTAGFSSGALIVLDISDPESPSVVKDTTMNRADNIKIYGNLAFVCCLSNGIYIVDITNPSDFKVLSHISGDYWDVGIKGNYLITHEYFTHGMIVFDISDPTLPVRYHPVYPDIHGGGFIYMKGDLMFITAYRHKLFVFNVENPFHPILLDSVDPLDYQCETIWVEGNYIYCGYSSPGVLIFKYMTNQPPIVTAHGPNFVPEGGAIDITASASDPDGDSVTFSWDLDNDGIFETPGQTVTFSAETYDGPSNYIVTVKASDGSLDAVDDTVVVVLNVDPDIGPLSCPIDPVQIGFTVSASADFTDPGKVDTHTALWTWGDSTESAGEVVESNGSGTVSGNHEYTTAGVYIVTLKVTDDDGGSDEEIYQYVVVYDPDAGFVTGGGWIDSPEGAYTADLSLTGKANFGFVSKYKKGASIPTGNTEFSFKVADLNFRSSSYQWLVIAGSKAKYKGEGTINGDGEFGFMLTATDGQMDGMTNPDLFRIKIWDKATEVVVYDNQMGDADDADASYTIGGGNIVIHSEKVKKAESAPEDEKIITQIPLDYQLSQNYPNPFNPSTEIQFELPVQEFVELKVFNSYGQVVKTLVASELAAGSHKVTWDGRDNMGNRVSTGLYLFQIRAGEFRQIRKMSYIR